MSIKDLAKIIIKLSKKKIKIKKENDVLDSPKRRLPDVSKAISLTGYKYQYTLEKGLDETFNWYKKNIFNNKKILNSYN